MVLRVHSVFEDMDMARAAGRESSARLSMVKDRLKKKASEKEAKKSQSHQPLTSSSTALAESEAALMALLKEEDNLKTKTKKKNSLGNGKK
jgi:hypothetical protein